MIMIMMTIDVHDDDDDDDYDDDYESGGRDDKEQVG